MNIHYDTMTGEIVCYGNAEYEDGADSYLAGCKVLMIADRDVDPQTQYIDLDTLEIVARDRRED
jgi:hypothetical protein